MMFESETQNYYCMCVYQQTDDCPSYLVTKALCFKHNEFGRPLEANYFPL